MTNSHILERVDAYLRSIQITDRVCIIHDTDPDGISSAVIMAKCIERLRGKKIDLHLPLDKAQYGITESMKKKIRARKITHLITCDFSAEHDLAVLKELEKQCMLLVIDHHKLYTSYQSQRTILYKPHFFSLVEPSTYCTAKLAYDAALRVCDVSDLDWMAAVGCIGDIATAPWTAWLKTVFRKYAVPWKKNLFKTTLGDVAATVSSTEVYDVRLSGSCFNVFYRANGPRDVLRSKLGIYRKKIDAELKKHLRAFTKAEKYGELYLYEMTSPYRVHSPLSTILGLKYPHRTIIIINKSLPHIAVSARRGDKKIAVNTLLEDAICGIPDSNAGGHVPAAGAGFHKKYLTQFKQQLLTLWNQKTSGSLL